VYAVSKEWKFHCSIIYVERLMQRRTNKTGPRKESHEIHLIHFVLFFFFKKRIRVFYLASKERKRKKAVYAHFANDIEFKITNNLQKSRKLKLK
jgi:hypothetical protein